MLSAMDRRTQQDYISWRAPELARSGHFRDWSEIVRQLRYEGAYAAHLVLMAPFKRETLNRLCSENNMNEREMLERDINGLRESIKLNWIDLDRLHLTREQREGIRTNTRLLAADLADLMRRLEELDAEGT